MSAFLLKPLDDTLKDDVASLLLVFVSDLMLHVLILL